MMTTIESMNSLFVSERTVRHPFRDKRAGEDRRVQDFGPPDDCGERRVRAERRYPEVLYAEIDEHIVIPPVLRRRSG